MVVFAFDEKRPLDKAHGESKVANAALQDYFDMGVKRSQRKLLEKYIQQSVSKQSAKRPPTLKINTITKWSDNFEWVRRVDIADVMRRDEDDRLMQERRLAVREADYNDGESLRGLGRHILDDAPNFYQTRRREIPARGDQPRTIVVTTKLNTGLAVKALETGSKIQRNALGLATDHLEVDEVTGATEEQVVEQRFERNKEKLVNFIKKQAKDKKEVPETNE